MNSYLNQAISLTFLTIIGLFTQLSGHSQAATAYPDIPYDGQRLIITKLKASGSNEILINLVNTGRKTVSESDFSNQTVILRSREDATTADLSTYYKALAEQKFSIDAGGQLEKLSIKIQGNLAKSPSKKDKGKKGAKSPKAKKNSADSMVTKNSKSSKAKKNNTAKNEASAANQEKVEVKKVEDKVKKKKQKEAIVSSPNEIFDAEEEEEAPFLSICADIIIKDIHVIKQTKKNIQFSYTLVNNGKGKANLKAIADQSNDLAINVFLSSGTTLSRGSIPIGGGYVDIEKGKETLSPGESHQGEMKVQLYKFTKFTPYLILQVDPYQKIMECNETNNHHSVYLLKD